MKITPLMEGTIVQLTRLQLYALLKQVPETQPAGMFRASDSALRDAVRTYLRMDRMTEAQVIHAKGQVC